MSACQGFESAYCSGEDCFSDCSENGVEDNAKMEVDVAVIGNGPSAIFLSLLLSGHVPYYAGGGSILQNPALKSKLDDAKGTSIIEQDLQYLSEGLEGRSKNPVALLFDTLLHPNADIGERNPSLLKWVQEDVKKHSHIVLGRDSPGGQWHSMDRNVLTLSLSDWLGLPIFTFNDWKERRKENREESDKAVDQEMETSNGGPLLPEFYPPVQYAGLRATVGDVADYYQDYVERMKLSDNFANGLTVEKIEMKRKTCSSRITTRCTKPRQRQAVSNNDCKQKRGSKESNKKEKFPEDKGVVCPLVDECHRWIIKSKRICHDNSDKQHKDSELIVEAKNLVLASGLNRPILLGVPGEDQEYVIDSATFRWKLPDIKRSSDSKVLIVGAGISGADMALLCLREGISCIHAFKQKPNDPNLMLTKMTPGIYQEYHYLHMLMNGTQTSPLYQPLSQHMVTEFRPAGECKLKNIMNDSIVTLNVSHVVVMIGYCADLDFLPDDVKTHIMIDPTRGVHCKHNPLDVDMYSFRSEVYPNLYALGPLTGDNFVRFVFGSGLGCAQTILKQQHKK